MEEKKLFFGQLNSDNNDYSIAKDHYLNALNINILNATDKNVGDVEGSAGTTSVGQVPFPLLGSFTTIGAAEDPARNRFLWVLINNSPEAPWGGSSWIMCYEQDSDTIYKVLKLDDFDSGEISYETTDWISSMVVIGDYLVWVSDGKPQYKINIDRAITKYQPAYSTEITPYGNFESPEDIMLAKKPPQTPPYLEGGWEYHSGYGMWNYREDFWLSDSVNDLLGEDSYIFSTRYVYNDGEISTMSPYSIMVQPSVSKSKTGIRVYYSNLQTPAVDVKYVELIARIGNSGESFIVDRIDAATYKTAYYDFYNTDRGNFLSDDYVAKASESVPIESRTVEAIDNRLALGNNTNGYDTPSLNSLTITPYYLGEDYTSDVFETSVFTPTIDNVKVLEWTKSWGDNKRTFNTAYIYLSNVQTQLAGWYELPDARCVNGYIYSWAWDTFRGDAQFNRLIFKGRTEEDIVGVGNNRPTDIRDHLESKFLKTTSNFSSLDTTQFNILNVPRLNHNQFKSGMSIFKSGSSFSVGVVYYDEQRRRALVSTNDSIIETPEYQYNMLDLSGREYIQYIEWALDGNLEDIPDWATHYQIVRTKSSIDSFLQFNTDGILYAYKDSEATFGQESYEFRSGGYWGGKKKTVIDSKVGEWNIAYGEFKEFYSAIAIPLKTLSADYIGYTWAEGDYISVKKQDGSVQFKSKITEVSNGYIFCEIVNIGDIEFYGWVTSQTQESEDVVYIRTTDWIGYHKWRYHCEIITPSTTYLNDYYEVSNVYSIDRAENGDGSLSVESGKIRGDVYINVGEEIEDNWICKEVMNRGDRFELWETDAMRRNTSSNLNNDIGQVHNETSLQWGGNLINGTSINNLSSFNAFDEEILSGKIGSIQKLASVSKVSEYGNVLLVVGENETLSVYVNENILTDTEGSEQVQQSTNFIGTIRELKGSYGTINPESFARYRGNAFWWDYKNRVVVRYSSAGLFPISDYFMESFFDTIAQEGVRMLGAVDHKTGEYMLKVPAMSPINFIEYPDDWDGTPVCEDSTVTGWGDGFTATWADDTCTKLEDALTWDVAWTGYWCTQETITFPQCEWGDYTCVKTESSKFFNIFWGDFLCTQETAAFGASWSDFTCTKINDEGYYTALWDEKICVNVAE